MGDILDATWESTSRHLPSHLVVIFYKIWRMELDFNLDIFVWLLYPNV